MPEGEVIKQQLYGIEMFTNAEWHVVLEWWKKNL